MSDFIPTPDVLTTVRVGGFTLYVYAYRRLTRAECKQAVSMYLQQTRLKHLPSHGSGKVYTIIGSNPADDL